MFTFKCYSIACSNQPNLEYGDRCLFPQSVLREITRLRLKLPVIFEVFNVSDRTHGRQVCGVMEFSSKENTVYMPFWMMQNIGLIEGGKIHIKPLIGIEKGKYIKIQPHDSEFAQMASIMGPKQLLEACLRHYTTLCKNETILVKHGDKQHYINVVEVHKDKDNIIDAISLCGDLDLEVEFASPLLDDEAIFNQITQNESIVKDKMVGKKNDAVSSKENDNTLIVNRNIDCLSSSKISITNGEITKNMTANSSTNKRSIGKFAKKKIDEAFKGIGKILNYTSSSSSNAVSNIVRNDGSKEEEKKDRGDKEEHHFCQYCLKEIPLNNFQLHVVRCQRNTAGHRETCCVCDVIILKSENHFHCDTCKEVFSSSSQLLEHINTNHKVIVCGCGTHSNNKEQNMLHLLHECVDRDVVCDFCSLNFKFCQLSSHASICGSRTEKCEGCNKFVQMKHLLLHQCETINSSDNNDYLNNNVASNNKIDVNHEMHKYNNNHLGIDLDKTSDSYYSPLCSKDIDLALAIKESLHINNEFNNQKEMMENLKTKKNGVLVFKCPNCEKDYFDYEELQVHVFTDCKKRERRTTNNSNNNNNEEDISRKSSNSYNVNSITTMMKDKREERDREKYSSYDNSNHKKEEDRGSKKVLKRNLPVGSALNITRSKYKSSQNNLLSSEIAAGSALNAIRKSSFKVADNNIYSRAKK